MHVCTAAAPAASEPATALVAGATGGVGQLVVARLLAAGWRVRALVRSEAKARALFGSFSSSLEIVEADLREVFCSDTQLQGSGGGAPVPPAPLTGATSLLVSPPSSERPTLADSALAGLFESLDAVVCCTGTTAFPSARWEGDNGPRQTDEVGVRNLVAAVQSASPSLRRFVLVSSIGVSRTGQFPFLILNAFGVLSAKAAGEKSLQDSGLPFTILRPGRLTDGCVAPLVVYRLLLLSSQPSHALLQPLHIVRPQHTPARHRRSPAKAAAAH